MGMLTIIDIETIQYSILAKFIKGINQNKTWTDSMQWHLDQYRKEKQGVANLRHKYTRIEALFYRPIELSQVLGQATQVIEYTL